VAAAPAPEPPDGPDFDALFRRYWRPLVVWIGRQTGGSSAFDAEDVAAEAFCRALGAAETYRPQAGSSPGSWLFKIAGNLLIDGYRRHAVRTRHGAPLPLEAVHRLAGPDPFPPAAVLDLRVAVAALPEAQRAALEAGPLADHDYRTAAREMGASEDAARQLGVRARRRLRRTLGPAA
jgi:RNA polymerase sigma-70 factor, ECF subfamily